MANPSPSRSEPPIVTPRHRVSFSRRRMSAAQLTLRIERPAGTPSLMLRAKADQRVMRADCDWTRDGAGFVSSNGWHVRPALISNPEAPRIYPHNGWAAIAPDGLAEWWALDPVTAMVRAEGGS